MTESLILAGTALAIVLTICGSALAAWRGWLEIKRIELGERMPGGGGDDTRLRIELADVRERLKRLEAIADGVEL
jgi:hypothetical protein